MISLGASDVFILMCVLFAWTTLIYHVGKSLGAERQAIEDNRHYSALIAEARRQRGH